jgi:3-deoxy-D-manno-octulosonic-acid transferase
MLILYTVLTILLSPLLLLAFVWRYGLRRTLRGLPERLGHGGASVRLSMERAERLWVHAASVGEVKAAEAFLREIPRRFPGMTRVLTTTTVAGEELARRLELAEEVRLAPLDLPFAVRGAVRRWRPRAAVLIETELWPHWIRVLNEEDVPLVVVNGRISDRTFRSYRLFSRLWSPLLAKFARVGAQSPVHAERYLALGARPERVVMTGNLKFDRPLPDLGRVAPLRRAYGFSDADWVWVCGSTHPGEEDALIAAAADLRREAPLKLVMAPRHVERGRDVRRRLEKAGFTARCRTSLDAPGTFDALVLDTVGELSDLYGVASAAFVGGSWVPHGGQNPLEPARWGIPVLFGPHMDNFREMAELFLRNDAARAVSDEKDLRDALGALRRDPESARRRGEAARRTADGQRGALDASLRLLMESISARSGRP